MAIRPFRFTEKLYAAVLLFQGSVQVAVYHQQGPTFVLGVGVGVWVGLLFMTILFSAYKRTRDRRDPCESVRTNSGGYP